MARVVLDANFTRGRFSRKALERLVAKIQHTGAVIVIPEVVLWEWAEHAVRSYRSLADQVSELNVDPLLMSAPTVDPIPEVLEVVGRIESALPKGCEIARHPTEAFREAVCAQVMQTGAAERKSGVKTGAADALVHSAVKVEVDSWDGLEPIVLATADGNLTRYCLGEHGDALLAAKDEKELLERLITFTPAEGDLAMQIERDMPYAIGQSATLMTLAHGFTVASRAKPPSPLEDERVELGRIEQVEIEDLKCEPLQADGTRLATANARIFATVDLEVSTFDPAAENEGGLLRRVMVNNYTMPGMVDVPIALTLGTDWEILSVDAAGDARIDFG